MLHDEQTPSGESGELDEDEELGAPAGTGAPSARPLERARESDPEDADELDDSEAEALADAEAIEEDPEAIPKPASSARSAPVVKAVALDPQARDGLIRCLQARIATLDATLAHATEVAARDTFYSRWPNVVTELRTQALKRLEELQRS